MLDEPLLFIEITALGRKLGDRETRSVITLDDPFESGVALTNSGTK